MEKHQVTFDVYAAKPVPPHLTPLVAIWYAPEADATRLFIGKALHSGMQVLHDRSYPRGPLLEHDVEYLVSVAGDVLYERLLAFVGVQPVLPDLPPPNQPSA